MVGIVDYKVGNLQSIINAFESMDIPIKVESNPSNLRRYDKVILPGVGAFGEAMVSLEESGMKEAVLEFIQSGKYLLGICLGMQLLCEKSYEFGERKGLGIIQGEVKKFDFDKAFKVPHMGWNTLKTKRDSALFRGVEDSFYLYFVHSYYVDCQDEFVIGKTNYKIPFASAVQKDNVFGIQPHPEKSHKNGLKILKNFANL